MRRAFIVWLIMFGLVGWAARTDADPITYTQSAIASGSIGGTTFTNALVTVSLTGDTASVAPFPAFPSALFNQGTAQVTIAGVGTATLTDANGIAIFSTFNTPVEFETGDFNSAVLIAQFDDAAHTSITHILGLVGDQLLGYNLKQSFGPFTNIGFGVADQPYPTSRGVLRFASGGDPVTFTALVNQAPVPEPASMLLFAGGLGLIAVRKRRRAQ